MRLLQIPVVLGLLAALPCVSQVMQPPVPVPGSPPILRPPGQNEGGVERSKKAKKKKGEKPKSEEPTLTFQGLTVSNDAKQIVVHTSDGRWITMTIDGDTQWNRAGSPIKPEQVVPGTTVKADAAEDGEADLTALTVELLKDPTPEQKEANAPPGQQADDVELTEAQKPIDAPDAPGRPRIRRGPYKEATLNTSDASDSSGSSKPKKAAAKDDDAQDFTIGAAQPIRTASNGGPGSDILQRAFAWADNFNQGLPNYLCRQITTRYVEQSHTDDWQPQDVVTANIVYQDGHEEYRDVMVGNKKVTDMTKTGGTWSTGEFASMLHSLFQPGRNTDFKYFRAVAVNDTPAAVFDYKVPLLRSDWRIIIGGQMLLPSYGGTIWVEKSSGVVRRVEQEALNIPKDFPLDEVQASIDYEEVSLGAQKFLLPVRAENISCVRSQTVCTKNVIEFRDYHKFAGESTIEFGK